MVIKPEPVGRARHATSATEKIIQHLTALRSPESPRRARRLMTMMMQQAPLIASASSRKILRRCRKRSRLSMLSLISSKSPNPTCQDQVQRKKPLVSSAMKLSTSLSSSPSSSQGFSIFSSKPMATRSLWTSSKSQRWTVSPRWISSLLQQETCGQDLQARARTPAVQLKSNGGSLVVGQKATIAGHKREFWFSASAIANIIALSNLIQQHHVTCNSDDLMFVVHREPEKPSTEFQMQESGLHCYNPCTEKNKQMAFINAVAENVSRFTKREIKGAEIAKALHGTLDCPSMKDLMWIVWSRQIKDSRVMFQDIKVAISIWGKNVLKLKSAAPRAKQVGSGG